MTYALNGEPLAYGQPFTIGDTNYTGAELIHWPREDLLALPGMAWVEPEPVAPTAEDICRQIDAERDRRQALDFEYDFGDAVAILDDGSQERAGFRSLQMAERNKRDWMGQHGRALAAMNRGEPNTTIFIRAEDNANLMVPAWMWIEAFEAGSDRDERLMAYGGSRKSEVRAAADPSSVNISDGWPE